MKFMTELHIAAARGRLRWCAHICLWAFAIVLLFSGGEGWADSAEQFKAACIPQCGARGHKPDFCGKYCDCNIAELRKKFGNDVFSQTAKSLNVKPEEILLIASTCNAHYLEQYFEEINAKECGSDVECREGNACVVGELRALGSEADIGAVLMAMTLKQSLGTGDNEKIARYTQIRHVCSGRLALKSLAKNCLQACGADAECTKSCSCLAKAVKAVGTEIQIGELLTKAGEGDAAAKQRYNTILTGCGLEAQ